MRICGSYSKNMNDTIEGTLDKTKLFNTNYKNIMFGNVILNNYLNM